MNSALEIISALLVVSFLGLLAVGFCLFVVDIVRDEIYSRQIENEMRARGETPPRF